MAEGGRRGRRSRGTGGRRSRRHGHSHEEGRRDIAQFGIHRASQNRSWQRGVERVGDRVRLRLVEAADARRRVGLEMPELERLERGLREDALAKNIDLLFVGGVLEEHRHPLRSAHIRGVDVGQDGVAVGAVQVLHRAEEDAVVHLGEATRLDSPLKHADELCMGNG